MAVFRRKPRTPEQIEQTNNGPRIQGKCSLCDGLMEQAVSGTAWHLGPSCHWHDADDPDCCAFIPEVTA